MQDVYCEFMQPSFRYTAISRNALGLLHQFKLNVGRTATLERSRNLKSLLVDLLSLLYRASRFAALNEQISAMCNRLPAQN